jgi:hypothetical protein
MIEYLGIAQQALERWQTHAQREPEAVAKLAETVPPVESWDRIAGPEERSHRDFMVVPA